MKLPSRNFPRRGQIIDIENHLVHVIESGPVSAPDVVLLHGCGSIAEEVISPFEGSDAYRVIAPDRPGYGFSTPLATNRLGPRGQAAWLESLLEALGGGPKILAAHSIGSAAVLVLAARRPDLVRGIFLIAPCCRPVPFKPLLLLRAAMAPLIGQMVRKQLTERWPEAVLRRALQSSALPNPVPDYLESLPPTHIVSEAAMETMAGELLAFNKDMSTLEQRSADLPVSVVFGTRDRVINPRWHCDWILSKHPNAEIKMLDAVGHMPHHAYPETCRQLLTELVGQVMDNTVTGQTQASHAA